MKAKSVNGYSTFSTKVTENKFKVKKIYVFDLKIFFKTLFYIIAQSSLMFGGLLKITRV